MGQSNRSDATLWLDGDIDLQRDPANLSLLMLCSVASRLLPKKANTGQRRAKMAVVRESLATEDLCVLAVRPYEQTSLDGVIGAESN